MNKAGWIALFLSVAGVFITYQVGNKVFEQLPHVEDEMAYVWQAEVYARGHLTAPSPPDSEAMYVPFVVNHAGQRSAKYPPGWPIMLSFGVRLGLRSWVNPLLAGLAVWLTYRLGTRIFTPAIALLACGLTLTSPFFLILSGSLHSSTFSLVLSLIFILAWFDTFGLGKAPPEGHHRSPPKWLTVTLAGLSLGLLGLTRPLTAVGVGLPFFIHGAILLIKGTAKTRLLVIAIGAITSALGSLFFVWQYGVTGSPLTDPYTLWWSFDRIGFGPGVGVYPGGYTLRIGLHDAGIMLSATWRDLFGWKTYSWLFLPFGLIAIRRNRPSWLVLAIFASLVGAYFLYWAQVTRYGPRYYYEGLPGLTLVTAAGIAWLAERARSGGWRLARLLLLGGLVVALVTYNLRDYLPPRFIEIYGLYGVYRDKLTPFKNPQVTSHTPALVFVKVGKRFTDYAGLIELEDPWLTTPFIFAEDLGPIRDAALAQYFPGRQVIYYSPYAAQPFTYPPGP